MKANFKRQNDCKSDNMLKILVSTEEGAKDSERLKHRVIKIRNKRYHY